MLLLGYLGVFESTTLDPYLEIANKLHEYVEAHQEIPDKEEELKDHLKVIEIIRTELETSLKRLSSPSKELCDVTNHRIINCFLLIEIK